MNFVCMAIKKRPVNTVVGPGVVMGRYRGKYLVILDNCYKTPWGISGARAMNYVPELPEDCPKPIPVLHAVRPEDIELVDSGQAK